MNRSASVMASLLLALAGPLMVSRAMGVDQGPVFAAKPVVSKDGDKVKVNFAVSAATDVEVAVVGQDGKVARHLAAGVLGGTNAPPPPLKSGLVQALDWDGKDDFGKPADGAPFKVRVRVGMGVKFGRMIGEDPYTFGTIDSIAIDEDGKLYMTAFLGDCNQYAQVLRVFGPDGQYRRTLIPFSVDRNPETVSNLATWNAARKTFIPHNFSSGNPALYPFSTSVKLVRASQKTGIVMASGTTVWRMDSDGGHLQGPSAMWSPAAKLNNFASNVPQLAISPDGKYIYYANVAGSQSDTKDVSQIDSKWPQGRVYRQDTTNPGSNPEKFYDLELPDWNQNKYWLPNAWNCRTAAYHIITDAKGHLHIGDLVNQEIVEVDGGGKKVAATKVPWPERFYLDDKTGDYYVLSRTTALPNENSGLKLLKIEGRGDGGKIVAELPLKTGVGRGGIGACFGRLDNAPVMWIGSRDGLVCIKDSNNKLEVIPTAYRSLPESEVDWSRIVVDSDRDEVYTNNGTCLTYRYDGNTGQGGPLKIGGKPFWCVDMAMGYDGSLYTRTGQSHLGPLQRYTHDLAPLAFTGTGSNRLWDIYSRMGIGFCDKGVGAGPNGECYTSYMYGWNKYFVAGFSGDGKPIKGNYLDGKLSKPDPKSDAAKLPADRQVTAAVVGPIPMSSGGINVDQEGNIYVGMLLVPKGYKPPAGFEKDPAYEGWTGSIVKFPPSGGTVLGAVKEDDQPNAVGVQTVCEKGVIVIGATALYPGLAPFSGGGYGGNGSSCVCRVPRFQVDRFGRIAFTNVVTFSATVLDNAGNKILEFGDYGNFDSQYVAAKPDSGKAGRAAVASPEFPLAWPTGAGASDQHIYVIDAYNKRVLRADKTWAAEDMCDVK